MRAKIGDSCIHANVPSIIVTILDIGLKGYYINLRSTPSNPIIDGDSWISNDLFERIWVCPTLTAIIKLFDVKDTV